MRTLLKRWWFWAGAAFIFAALLAGYLLIPVKQSEISQANCDKIQLRMSEAQVREILGQAKRTSATFIFDEVVEDTVPAVRPTGMVFGDEDGNAIFLSFGARRRLEFGTTNCVTEKRFVPTELSIFEIMKRRIERRIEEVRDRFKF
jgi:hypothetical protein